MQSLWVHRPLPRERAAVRLFCLPYSGGGTAVFRGWAERLPPEVELCAIRLPGREGRFREPPLRRLDRLVALLLDGVAPLLGPRCAFFGHSLGALIAFELCRALATAPHGQPLRLFVSGRSAPLREPSPPFLHALPEEGLWLELEKLHGGAAALPERELLALMLPTLRADFELGETYRPTLGAAVNCPITAFGGDRDDEVPVAELDGWRAVTRGAFSRHVLAGNHFFLHERLDELLALIAQDLIADVLRARESA